MSSSARRIALSMPSARMSTLSSPSASRSSLSHWHDAAALHRRVLHRHQLRDLVARDHEAAGVLRQVAREADQLVRQLDPQLHDRRLGVEAVLAQALGADAAAVEPLLALGHRVDALQVDAQRAADVAHRRARPVADDHRGQRGAVAAVLAVDVLDDLLAALVLEVDVDVGRLVALGADEALEQQRWPARGSTSVTPQAVADRRVGRAAAALAQDALRARPLHDVGDGQEVGLVARAGAISASSCSICARTFGGAPGGSVVGGKRRARPLR